MRARLAVAVSGTQVELREVKLASKPTEMLAASPKGTVPVLVLSDGSVIDKSLDVMRWALSLNDPEHWLKRTDESLIARNDGPFKHDLDRYKYPDRHGSDALSHRASGVAFLGELDTRLAANGQLCDAAPGLTDIAIMPFVRQFAAADPAWFAEQPLPHLKHWLTAHLGSPLFAAVMTKFVPWKPGNPPVFFSA